MNKTCSKCGLEQTEANFSKAREPRDGLQHFCKNCNRAYREAHREKNIAFSKQYYAENKEQISEQKKQHYNGNKEKHRDYRRQYFATHIKQIKLKREGRKDLARKVNAIWNKNHPDADRIRRQTRRARKAGLARTLTPAQWNHILNEFNNTCAYCGIGDKKLHQEHFIALSIGGEYTHDNIIPACGNCNTSKGKKDFFIWYPTSNCYDKQREKKIMKFLHYTGATQQLALW
jgi:5-methylcytosine-specific restriction endonuclease McrA